MDGNTEELLKNLEKLGIGTSLQKKRDPASTTSVGGTSSSSTTKPMNKAKKDIPTFSSSTSTQQKSQATSSNTKPEFKITEKDLDAKTLDELTKKIAKELGTDFLSDSEDEEFEEEEDDAAFRTQIMEEFKKFKSSDTDIPKQTLKQLYMQLLKSSPMLMKDKAAADQFLSKLSSDELSKLMEILQMTPDETLKYFNNDPDILEAIKNTPTLNPTGKGNDPKGLWNQLLDVEDEELLEGEAKQLDIRQMKEKASGDVKNALKQFEENIIHYSQNPDALLSLTQKMTPNDENTFLTILFHEYTPERMKEKLGMSDKVNNTRADGGGLRISEVKDLKQVINHELVAEIFKEVFSHFRAYKKNPQRFNELTNRMSDLEKQAFESLVKSFWNVSLDDIKI